MSRQSLADLSSIIPPLLVPNNSMHLLQMPDECGLNGKPFSTLVANERSLSRVDFADVTIQKEWIFKCQFTVGAFMRSRVDVTRGVFPPHMDLSLTLISERFVALGAFEGTLASVGSNVHY